MTFYPFGLLAGENSKRIKRTLHLLPDLEKDAWKGFLDISTADGLSIKEIWSLTSLFYASVSETMNRLCTDNVVFTCFTSTILWSITIGPLNLKIFTIKEYDQGVVYFNGVAETMTRNECLKRVHELIFLLTVFIEEKTIRELVV